MLPAQWFGGFAGMSSVITTVVSLVIASDIAGLIRNSLLKAWLYHPLGRFRVYFHGKQGESTCSSKRSLQTTREWKRWTNERVDRGIFLKKAVSYLVLCFGVICELRTPTWLILSNIKWHFADKIRFEKVTRDSMDWFCACAQSNCRGSYSLKHLLVSLN